MKRRTRIAMSVVSGIAAACIAMVYASSVRAEANRAREEALARYGGDMVQVCVATRDIDAGETIDEGNTALEEWVASLLPADAETSLKKVVGKKATAPIPKRAVLCPAYFRAREDAVEVPAGKVAVSVASDAAHAVGGAVSRGEGVDVYVSKDGVADRLCAATVVDTSALAEGGDVTWVTLAVSPERVRELLVASGAGQVTLVVPGEGASARSDAEGGEA